MTRVSIAKARARVRELTAELKEARAKEAAAAAAKAKAHKALERFDKPYILRRSSGDELWRTMFMHVGWGIDESKPRAALLALTQGKGKVNLGGSNERSVKSVSTMARLMDPYDAKRIKSLDRRIARLQAEKAAIIKGAFDRGTKASPEEWAHLALRATKLRRPTFGGYGYNDSTGIAMRLTIAKQHLEWAQGERATECPCSWCVQARANEKREAEYAARQKAIDKARALHKRHSKFHAECELCVREAHEDDAYRGMSVVESHHTRPRPSCPSCTTLKNRGYKWDLCVPPKPVVDLEDDYEADDGEVEYDEVEEGVEA